jgi:hypothetical protein
MDPTMDAADKQVAATEVCHNMSLLIERGVVCNKPL